jgi:hypothetical protein
VVGDGGRGLNDGDERRLRREVVSVTMAQGVESLSAMERPATEGRTPCDDLVKVL